MELRLHSPVGSDPVVYKWPMIIGRGSVSNDSDNITHGTTYAAVVVRDGAIATILPSSGGRARENDNRRRFTHQYSWSTIHRDDEIATDP